MTHTEDDQPDTLTRSDQKLRDLLKIRSYLRDRRDELLASNFLIDAKVIGDEVSRLNNLIAEAEAAQ
jgi:hypothetical protein